MRKAILFLFLVALIAGIQMFSFSDADRVSYAYADTADAKAGDGVPENDGGDGNDEAPEITAPPSEVSIAIPFAALSKYSTQDRLKVELELVYERNSNAWHEDAVKRQFIPDNQLKIMIPIDKLSKFSAARAAKIVLDLELSENNYMLSWVEQAPNRQYLPKNLSGLNVDNQNKIWFGFIALAVTSVISLLMNITLIASRMKKNRKRHQ
jgi:hypothetical protein